MGTVYLPCMAILQWDTDDPTARAAAKYCPIKVDQPSSEFAGGKNFRTSSWEHRVVQPSAWPKDSLFSSPDQIIRQFQDGHYTQGLAMVASWGTMQRTPDAIWGRHEPAYLEKVLHQCSVRIHRSKTIRDSWEMLTGRAREQLGWTAVITSKTLHFLCRSLGFDRNPPVAIDGLIIVQRVWPDFRDHSTDVRPAKWTGPGNPLDAYNRYMTAIRTWADQLQWTTTQVEQTVYEAFYPEVFDGAKSTAESLTAENARLRAENAALRALLTPPTPPALRADANGRLVKNETRSLI